MGPAGWYVACRSRRLGTRPLSRRVLGVPLALWRDASGRAAALVDRCPHRAMPLSAGRVRGDGLECSYHGWRFGPDGRCLAVPGLPGEADRPERRAEARACVEQDGFAWVKFPAAPGQAEDAPPRLEHVHETGAFTIRLEALMRGTMHAVAENILDVPHTSFLHRGLFRTAGPRREVDVEVVRGTDRVEARFLGEPRPSGLLGRLLAPGGETVEHADRFVLPCLAEVEYGCGDSRAVISHLLTPEDERSTRVYWAASVMTPLPRWLVAPAARILAARIVAQDARALRLQSENLARFGGAVFASTELDVLGPHVGDLLRHGRAEPMILRVRALL